MISVAQALNRVCDLASPSGTGIVPLADASGRALAKDIVATRDQPPFDSSAMDGYAAGAALITPGATFRVVGEATAGHGFAGRIGPGETVRIFTGAPVPDGADHIILQEEVQRSGDIIILGERIDEKPYIRPAGSDFRAGHMIGAPRLLRPADLALIAAMNVPCVTVRKRPGIALLATGDELVMPGETPAPDQIIASNGFGLKAMLERAGAEVRMLPIARDDEGSLRVGFELAAGADLIVTIGGASVGDHDLVGRVAGRMGMERAFHKVAMRPGKPLMAGRMSGAAMVGLPGNPVSSMICGQVFLLPMIRKMLGLKDICNQRLTAPLHHHIGANGAREHYMRGRIDNGELTVFERQDSALLSVLSDANALIIRPPHDPERQAGDVLEYLAT